MSNDFDIEIDFTDEDLEELEIPSVELDEEQNKRQKQLLEQKIKIKKVEEEARMLKGRLAALTDFTLQQQQTLTDHQRALNELKVWVSELQRRNVELENEVARNHIDRSCRFVHVDSNQQRLILKGSSDWTPPSSLSSIEENLLTGLLGGFVFTIAYNTLNAGMNIGTESWLHQCFTHTRDPCVSVNVERVDEGKSALNQRVLKSKKRINRLLTEEAGKR